MLIELTFLGVKLDYHFAFKPVGCITATLQTRAQPLHSNTLIGLCGTMIS